MKKLIIPVAALAILLPTAFFAVPVLGKTISKWRSTDAPVNYGCCGGGAVAAASAEDELPPCCLTGTPDAVAPADEEPLDCCG
jgi:hypothetical protein